MTLVSARSLIGVSADKTHIETSDVLCNVQNLLSHGQTDERSCTAAWRCLCDVQHRVMFNREMLTFSEHA